MKQDLTIQGMSCNHCVHAVREALEGLEGLSVLDVSIGHAVIETQAGSAIEERIREVLDEEGYPLESVSSAAE